MYTNGKLEGEPNIIITGITAIVILFILIIGLLSVPITIVKDKLK
jgi:hypothetical protein